MLRKMLEYTRTPFLSCHTSYRFSDNSLLVSISVLSNHTNSNALLKIHRLVVLDLSVPNPYAPLTMYPRPSDVLLRDLPHISHGSLQLNVPFSSPHSNPSQTTPLTFPASNTTPSPSNNPNFLPSFTPSSPFRPQLPINPPNPPPLASTL